MIYIKYKKIFIFLLFIFCNLFITNRVFAVNLELETPKYSLGIGEQFYVDLVINTEGQSINTIKGEVSFVGDTASFVRMENHKSVLNLWLDEPKIENNIISFIGMVPNGYEGTIDPFNPSQKIPGQVIRLVFEAKKVGKFNLFTSPFYLNLNDGLGTPIEVKASLLTVSIDNFVFKNKYDERTPGMPELEAYITRDEDIYFNKYILIFRAFDKDSGIKNVIVKEGWRGWKEIKSPYLLKDQSRHSDISIQATNNNGASIILKMNKTSRDYRYLIFIFLLLLILFFIFEKRHYDKKKKMENATNNLE